MYLLGPTEVVFGIDVMSRQMLNIHCKVNDWSRVMHSRNVYVRFAGNTGSVFNFITSPSSFVHFDPRAFLLTFLLRRLLPPPFFFRKVEGIGKKNSLKWRFWIMPLIDFISTLGDFFPSSLCTESPDTWNVLQKTTHKDVVVCVSVRPDSIADSVMYIS